ncbi:copper chaperone for superoxide dismutase [Paragonimus westermani]|uniref:Copper chaperone for superoxide dismutase n=1 Tax=Paragonimus westermani TaxID=34504 RepID=A0A5J4NYR6_9TREM|nr:copper chaperone for superoxide dismutase [Paragonimus westermani]
MLFEIAVNFAGAVPHQNLATLLEGMPDCDFGSGVATILKGEIMCGVCRLFQPSEETLIVDVSVDNLPPERHITLTIHALGDLSGAAESCGDVFVNHQGCSGKLGSFLSDSNGRGVLVTENADIKLWEVIGRSIVLHDEDSQTSFNGFCSLPHGPTLSELRVVSSLDRQLCGQIQKRSVPVLAKQCGKNMPPIRLVESKSLVNTPADVSIFTDRADYLCAA